jgi:repressor LexA
MSDTQTTAEKVTARQAEVLAFIAANSGFYGPTVREIAASLGIKSPNGVVCHLDALERKGLIKRTPGIARGIELTEAAK